MQLYHSDDSPVHSHAPDQTEVWQRALAMLQDSMSGPMPPEIQEATRLLQSQLPTTLPHPPPPVDASRQPPLARVEPDAAALTPPPAQHPSIAGSSSTPAVASSSATARKARSYTTASDVWGMVGTPNFQPLELTWNSRCQPDGPPDVMKKLKRFLTSLVRMSEMLPINHSDWRRVPKGNVDRSFGVVQVSFFFTSVNFLSMLMIKLTSIDYFDRSASAFLTHRRSATFFPTWAINGKNGSTPSGQSISRILWRILLVLSTTRESPPNNLRSCTGTTMRRQRG